MSSSAVSQPTVRASIDVGTNTALLLVLDAGGAVLEDVSRIVRLGKGVDASGVLDPAACERTMEALREYARILDRHGVATRDVISVTTATARDARNGAEFFARIESEFGFRFRTLSGEEEATASFRGALLPSSAPDRSLVFDLGGGSLEFQTAREGVSLQVGSVRFTERFLKSDPVTDGEFWACEEAINEVLEPVRARFGATAENHGGKKDESIRGNAVSGPGVPGAGALLSGSGDPVSLDERATLPPVKSETPVTPVSVIGVAGTVVTLGALHLGLERFDRAALDGLVLTRGDVHRLVEDLKWRNRAERLAMVGMEPGREDVILAGALIVWRLLECFGYREFTISTRGLRYGVLE